jgi:O-antigen biosynthesis protein
LFVGSFGHDPNRDAVHWLAETIVPLVQRQDPSIVIRVIGSDMPSVLLRLERPGLELVGPVPDIGAALAEARLTVAPLRYGAGLKSKVVESLAAGVPCVGTSIAYEGIEAPDLVTAIADTPEAFAATLARLYADEAAYTALAAAGRRYACDKYHPEAIDALMRSVVAPVHGRWSSVEDVIDAPVDRAAIRGEYRGRKPRSARKAPPRSRQST